MDTVAQDGLGVKAIVQVNETAVRGELKEMVRQSVEETLNGLLDAEADRLCKAGRYERNAERVDTRAGTYERGLLTSAGESGFKGA
jgi:transposase-like protein